MQLYNKIKSKKAFTLAEVVLTLVIIGILSSMSIPSLIAQTEKQEYATRLKKSFAAFNQAIALMTKDYGCTGDLKCTGKLNIDANYDIAPFGDAITPYFNVSKNCRNNTSCTGVFSSMVAQNYDGSSRDFYFQVNGITEFYRFTTADGTAYAIVAEASNANCTTNYSSNKTNNLTQVCAQVYIDVNGSKGPNNLGRDVLAFYISNGKGPMLYPLGGQDDVANGSWRETANYLGCGVGGQVSGWLCAARVIEEGWQMNY